MTSAATLEIGIAVGASGLPLSVQLPLAAQAESRGICTLAVGDATHDVFAVLGALATTTSTAALMAGVATWTRPPVVCARAAATVDQLSGGRLVLGLGPMPAAWSQHHYGIDPARPLARMREYVEVVRGALAAHSGTELNLKGEFFRVEGYTANQPPVRAHIPIHLAATRSGMAKLAGEVADGVLYNLIHTPRWLADVLVPATAAGVRLSGRPIRRGALVIAAIHPDPAEGVRRLQRTFADYLQIPYFTEVAAHAGYSLEEATAHHVAGDLAGAAAAIPEELVLSMGVVGETAAGRSLLDRYRGVVDWVEVAPPRGLGREALQRGMIDMVQAFGLAGGNRDHR